MINAMAVERKNVQAVGVFSFLYPTFFFKYSYMLLRFNIGYWKVKKSQIEKLFDDSLGFRL